MLPFYHLQCSNARGVWPLRPATSLRRWLDHIQTAGANLGESNHAFVKVISDEPLTRWRRGLLTDPDGNNAIQ